MSYPGSTGPAFLKHFSEKLDCPVKIEKEEFILETDGETCSYIPEFVLAKDEYSINTLDLPKNDTKQQGKLNENVKLERLQFKQETLDEGRVFPFKHEEYQPKTENLRNSFNLLENDITPKEELDCPFKIENEEFVQEETHTSYIKEVCLIKSEYLTTLCDLPVKDIALKKEISDTNKPISSSRNELVGHIRKHTDDKPFKCDSCPSRFAKRNLLVTHIRIHTGERPFKCDSCSASFARKSCYVTHIRTHTGEKPFQCNLCSSKFSTRDGLIGHTRMHTGEKPFKCGSCSSAFTMKSHLVTHTRKHTGEKPYRCDYCSAEFSFKSQLVLHIRTHTGEKPFKCDICSNRFPQRSQLASHMRKHTGEKPFSCDLCSARYAHKPSLRYHVRVHTGGKTVRSN